MLVAAGELATPLSYALIHATICEGGPVVPGMPILALARVTRPELEGVAPRPETDLVFPPLEPFDEGPTGLFPGTPPSQPPTLQPPALQPPSPEAPLTPRPLTQPPTRPPPIPPLIPPLPRPPVTPPGLTPPFVLPPPEQPDLQPPTTSIPEPRAWMLMILGFGLVGARVRRRAPGSA
jgi:hypothetical protein